MGVSQHARQKLITLAEYDAAPRSPLPIVILFGQVKRPEEKVLTSVLFVRRNPPGASCSFPAGQLPDIDAQQ